MQLSYIVQLNVDFVTGFCIKMVNLYKPCTFYPATNTLELLPYTYKLAQLLFCFRIFHFATTKCLSAIPCHHIP